MIEEPFDRASTPDPSAKSPLARVLDPAIDESRVQSNWHRIVAARASATPGRIPRWVFAATAATAAAIAIYIAWPAAPHAGPLSSTNAIPVAAGATVESPVSFDDGSRVELAAGARLEVLTNDAERFVTLLHAGRARFDVHPGGPRRWEIETPRATVEVVGTSFVIDASEHRVAIEVDRGVVVVRGERVPGRVVRLTPGQHLSIDDPEIQTTELVPPSAVVATPRPAAMQPAGGRSPAPLAPTSSSPPKPLELSRPPDKLPPPIPTRATGVAPILADADRLRTAGDPAGAAAVLEQALSTGRPDESTGLVAFSLGRLYLDELADPDKATAAFAKVVALGTPRSLLEDAYARRIEALVKAGRQPLARDALAEYDRLYPHGVRRAALHKLVK